MVRNYAELNKLISLTMRIRSFSRSLLIRMLSELRHIDIEREWIRFPFYHHVFDDERKGFEAQLKYMKSYGDFVSLEHAVAMMESSERIGGRYFCVSFDDGFKNCVTNALPILIENDCPAAFFVATDYIGCDVTRDRATVNNFFSRSMYPKNVLIDFMDWDDCGNLVDAGMTIGALPAATSR